MSPNTIFFSTNNYRSPVHEECIRRICGEINTPDVLSQFTTVQCITRNPVEILQQLQEQRDNIVLFHFGGRDDDFKALMDISPTLGIDSLPLYLANLPQLDIVFLSYCSRKRYVEPLRQAGIKVVVGTSRHIAQEQATKFATVFYQQFLIADRTTEEAFNQAIQITGIPPSDKTRQYAGLHGDKQLRRRWRREDDNLTDEPLTPRVVGGDPLDNLSLPILPVTIDRPSQPFPGVRPYRRTDTHVFLGRDKEILALYNSLTTHESQPIILLHGQAGIGKSSLLNAGVLPLLEKQYEIYQLDGQQKPRLFEATCQLIKARERTPTEYFWHRWLDQQKKDAGVLLVIDQFDTQIGAENPYDQLDLAYFVRAIQYLVNHAPQLTKHRVILCLRTENLPKLMDLLTINRLAHLQQTHILYSLTGTGLRDIFQEFTKLRNQQTTSLLKHYQFSIEDGLEEKITQDLMQDQDSSIAPFFQVILLGLWNASQAKGTTPRHFSLQCYEQMYKDGKLFYPLLDEGIGYVCWPWPRLFRSQWALIRLAGYTSWSKALKNASFPIKTPSPQLINSFKNIYLLTEVIGTQGRELRLGHTLLEPLIEQRLSQSSKYSQQLQASRPDLSSMMEYMKYTPERLRNWFMTRSGLLFAKLMQQAGQKIETTWSTLLTFTIVVLGLFLFFHQQLQSELKRLDLSNHFGMFKGSQLFLVNTQATNTSSEPSTQRKFIEFVAGVDPIQPGVDIRFQRIDLIQFNNSMSSAYANQTIRALAFSPDGTLLFAANDDNSIETWTVADGQAHPSFQVNSATTTLLMINAGNSTLLYAGKDGNIGMLKIDPWQHDELPQQHELIDLPKHEGPVTSIQASTDGSQIITSGHDGNIHFYNIYTKELRTLPSNPSGPISAIALHPSGNLIAYTGSNNLIYIWDLTTTNLSHQLQGHNAKVNSLEFNLDGGSLLSAAQDSTVRIWRMGDHTEEYRFTESMGSVAIARYFPDGALMVAGSDDGFIRVWNVDTYLLLAAVEAHPGGISALAIRPDGKQVASAGWNGQLTLWDILPVSPIMR